jgi:hypothetical protein
MESFESDYIEAGEIRGGHDQEEEKKLKGSDVR